MWFIATGIIMYVIISRGFKVWLSTILSQFQRVTIIFGDIFGYEVQIVVLSKTTEGY